ncbi:MAG: RNA polymerase sigma factor [Proteobacteria bacterium]|nr:RNA polymerase sigma factor [Pseudomonadota bacterium]
MSVAGHEQSEALFREYRERLTRFAIRLVGSGADADDLVQDTFLKAHRHLCNGRTIRAPLSFLIVTMRNLVNDAHRRSATVDLPAALELDEAAAGDEAPSVERQVMSEREFESLCVAITQLPERMRYAFVLRKVYGYSCREIAGMLGRSVNTVREQVAQSFKRLQAPQDEQSEPGAGRRQGQTRDGMRPINTTPLPSRETP